MSSYGLSDTDITFSKLTPLLLLKQVQVVTVTSQTPRGHSKRRQHSVAGSHWHYAQPMGIKRLVDHTKVD